MYRHSTITKDAQGNLTEGFIVSKESARALKAQGIPGLVAITESKRVNHPSPAVMQKALDNMGINATDFYTMCESIKAESGEPETDSESTAE